MDLYRLVKVDQLIVIKYLLGLGASDFYYGMHYACMQPNQEIIKYLISQESKSQRKIYWDMGLYGACISGNHKNAKIMIKYGASHFKMYFGTACKSNNKKLYQMILNLWKN